MNPNQPSAAAALFGAAEVDQARPAEGGQPATAAAPAQSVASIILDCIERDGAKYVFGVPGSAVTPMHQALKNHSLRYVLAKHEQGAAFMAYGYARVKRSVGVVITTTGPGATNAITPTACGLADGVPMLVLTGGNAASYYGMSALQDSTVLGSDLVGMFSRVTKFSASIPAPQVAQRLTERAIDLAHDSRPGPSHLNLPVDVQKQQAVPQPRSAAQVRYQSRPVDVEAAREAARLLAAAKHPAILAGYGTVLSGAWDALIDLASRLRIPVATTPKAKGVFPESHPLSLGVFGFGGHPRAEAWLLEGQCDVLLVVGSSLGELVTHHWDRRLLPQSALIQLDIDPREIGKNYPVDVPLVGDSRATLEAMSACVDEEELRRGESKDDPLLEVRKAVTAIFDRSSLITAERPLKPQRLVVEMRKVLPEDALLFVDIGNSIIWAGHYFTCNTPLTYHLGLGYGSMGTAVAGAIGGKLAAPDRPVVALVGDGAFAMNGFEVHTAVENNIPVVWVVLNNFGHGMVSHGERMVFGSDLGSSLFRARLDVCGIARSMGAEAVRVESASEFRVALERALQASGPVVIDAIVDPDEVPQPLARRARGVKDTAVAAADPANRARLRSKK